MSLTLFLVYSILCVVVLSSNLRVVEGDKDRVEFLNDDGNGKILGSHYLSRSVGNMPWIGFGTAAMAGSTVKNVCDAVKSGFTLIDTAQAIEWYNEDDLGIALEQCWPINEGGQKGGGEEDKDVMVVTKIHPRNYSPARLAKSLLESRDKIFRKRSNSQYLNFVALLHTPWCWEGQCTAEQLKWTWKDAWRQLEGEHESNIVGAIGVSNFGAGQLSELLLMSNTRIAVVQNWMDPFHQDKQVRELCREHGIVYMAYSSFGTQWEWKLKKNPVFTDETLKKIALKHEKSIAQVVLSWAYQEGIVIIPRSSNIQHTQANADMIIYMQNHINGFLNESDMIAIANLDQSLGSLW